MFFVTIGTRVLVLIAVVGIFYSLVVAAVVVAAHLAAALPHTRKAHANKVRARRIRNATVDESRRTRGSCGPGSC